MAFEGEQVKVLKQEYLRLYEKFQHLKELARIDLDLLSQSVDLENVPGAKAELDRVHELVHTLMNGEMYHHMDPFDEKLYEHDGKVLETDNVNLIENDQNVETVTDTMKPIENTTVVKTENINLDADFQSSVNASNPAMNLQYLDGLLAQLASMFTEQQMIDAFSRLLEHTFNKVYGAPNTSQRVLPLTQTVQEHDTEDTTNNMVMDTVTAIPTNDSIVMDRLEAFSPRKRLKRPKKKQSKTSDLLPISLQHLITPRIPDSEKKDDGKKKSAATATVMPTEKIYECKRCGLTLEDRNLYNQHRKIHAKEDNTCTVCGKQFSNNYWLKQHTLLHSSEKPFLCKICGKAFHTKYYLKNHVERHDKNKPKLYCEVCGKSFASRFGLSKHMISHSKEKLKCSICDKQYKSVDALSSHEKQHIEHFPHQCSKCGRGFTNLMQLNVHERIHIGESPVFTCSICHKTFSSKAQHSAHKQSHIPFNLYKPYNCSLCQEQFKGSLAMAEHMLTHPEDLQFCILCQQTFDSPSDLQSHVTSTHLVKKNFKCSICGDKFSSPYKLSNHKAYHTNADPFKCNDCGKSFASGLGLRTHRMSKHLKTKKYQCEYCGRNFYYATNLCRHVQNHKGLKPWTCSVCGKGFAQKITLETHSWTHRADKRFSCENCGRGFNEKRALLSHRKTQHQDQQDSSGMNDSTMVLS